MILLCCCEFLSPMWNRNSVYSPDSTWLVTSRHDTTCSTCRVNAFWLCRACRTMNKSPIYNNIYWSKLNILPSTLPRLKRNATPILRLPRHTRHDELDWLDIFVSTCSTRRTCRVVSRRDVTSQVELGLIRIIEHATGDDKRSHWDPLADHNVEENWRNVWKDEVVESRRYNLTVQ